eukprot:11779898-Alexandrium_andersonii.AAC.1
MPDEEDELVAIGARVADGAQDPGGERERAGDGVLEVGVTPGARDALGVGRAPHTCGISVGAGDGVLGAVSVP